VDRNQFLAINNLYKVTALVPEMSWATPKVDGIK